MKVEKRNIKKIIKKKIDVQKSQTKMGARDKLRRGGTPPKHIHVNLVNRDLIRRGIDLKNNFNYFNLENDNLTFLTKKPTSIIISFKESSYERRRNLKKIINFFSKYLCDSLEIVIVEQDVESKINWLNNINNNEYINHIFIKSKKIFNKGWGNNIGAKHAKHEYLIFNDSDVLVSPEAYVSSLNLLNDYDIVNPYKYIYWLNEQETNDLNNKNIKLIRKIYQPKVITGGIFLIKKDIFFNIKGFDENSFGWGSQDGILDEKIIKLDFKIKINESIAIHLNHDGNLKPGSNNKISDDEYFSYAKRNLNIHKEYIKMTKDEILNKIDNTKIFGEAKKKIMIIKPKNKLISVVMAYYNRRKHLINTLHSMTKSKYKNFEVIVVDDASDDEHRIEDLKDQFKFLKVFRVEKENKNYKNPSIPTNIGLSHAFGEIIIIQNPECFHYDDVFNHVVNNLNKSEYLAYTTLNKDISDKLKTIDWSIDYNKQINKIIKIDKNNSTTNEWYCHKIFRPMALNFCTAIKREDLIELNGFDERYAYGVERDDVEFLDRIKRKGMKIVFIDEIIVIHQTHNKLFYENVLEYNALRTKNHQLYARTTAKETIIRVNPDKEILK